MSFTLTDKIKILEYSDKHSLSDTVEAIQLSGKNLSIKTLYRWRSQRKRVLEDGGTLMLLAPKSKKPKQYRTCQYDSRISEYVAYLRKTYPVMGKSKLLIFVDRYCELHNIKKVSEPTIGRIIRRLKDYGLLVEYNQVKMMSLDGSTGKLHVIKDRKSNFKKIRRPANTKPTMVGDIVQLDTVTIQVKGIKTYFINAIDLVSKKIVIYPCKKLNSNNAMLCLQSMEKMLGTIIKAVQTDNGLEHYKDFDQYLKTNNIIHYWNRPATPKSNGTVERVNRTMQEECICHNLNLCNPARMAELEKVIEEYLQFYHNIRPHYSLQNLTPQQMYNQLMGFSHM